MDTEALVKKCIEICEDHKGEGLTVFDLRGRSSLADFYLLCNGNSSAHIQALADHLLKDCRDLLPGPRAIEGTAASRWIVLDFSDVLIHLFHPEMRDYYQLDALLEAEPVYYRQGGEEAPPPRPPRSRGRVAGRFSK